VDKATYCRTVCGAKCCSIVFPGEELTKCPRLSEDNSCSVYSQRYPENPEPLVVVGYWQLKNRKDLEGNPVVMPFWCGRVDDLIKSGMMPKSIEDQCCYAHPELLEDSQPPPSQDAP